MAKGDYKVGYGRPPVDTQFKKGQCPNPKGRPKKKLETFATIFEEALAKPVSIPGPGGSVESLPLIEVIVKVFARKAAKGDLAAIKALMKLREHARLRGEANKAILMIGDITMEEYERRHGIK